MSLNLDKFKRDSLIGEELEYKYKSELMDFLYLYVDLYQLRYCIIKTQEHAQQLKQQTYYITPHYHGYNYFLIFKKLSDNILGIYLVYRMDLKFQRTDLNLNNIKIYKLNYNLNFNIDNINNSIFDGKLVFKKDQKIFLINDLLYYNNQKFFTFKLEEKINIIDNELDLLNNFLNVHFIIKSIRLYKYNEMSDLIYNKIKNSDFKINGIVFLPNRSSRIFIYINDSEFESIKNSPNLEIISTITNIKLPSNSNLQNRRLLLQKTQIVDVYEVFTLDKTIRFGICSIPNIKLSHKLRQYFDSNDQLITDCEFDNKFSKWKPIF